MLANSTSDSTTIAVNILGIVTSLRLVTEELWVKVGEQLQSLKVLAFAIGVVHGALSSRQIVGTAGNVSFQVYMVHMSINNNTII